MYRRTALAAVFGAFLSIFTNTANAATIATLGLSGTFETSVENGVSSMTYAGDFEGEIQPGATAAYGNFMFTVDMTINTTPFLLGRTSIASTTLPEIITNSGSGLGTIELAFLGLLSGLGTQTQSPEVQEFVDYLGASNTGSGNKLGIAPGTTFYSDYAIDMLLPNKMAGSFTGLLQSTDTITEGFAWLVDLLDPSGTLYPTGLGLPSEGGADFEISVTVDIEPLASVSAVPVPASLPLFATGLMGLMLARRRERR